MEAQESIEELENRLRRVEESYDRMEITKLHLLKQLVHLRRERVLDELIDEEYGRMENIEVMRCRLLKKKYYKLLYQIKQIEREIERKKGIKQSGPYKKLKPAAPRAKKLVCQKCFTVSK